MARLFPFQTLIRASSQSSSSSSFLHLLLVSPRILSHSHRHRSDQSGEAQLIEVDIDSSSSSSSSSNDDVEVLGIRKLEDVIHNIIVKRSAPDWLPFIPGSSYWVPPLPSHRHGLFQVISKLTDPLADDESLSPPTIRG